MWSIGTCIALDLNEIRGFGYQKPLLKAIFLTGALSIGGIPGFSGYVSKTLLHESIVEYASELAAHGEPSLWIRGIEWVFLLTGGMTIAYMTKLFAAVFWRNIRTDSRNMMRRRHI